MYILKLVQPIEVRVTQFSVMFRVDLISSVTHPTKKYFSITSIVMVIFMVNILYRELSYSCKK